MYQSSTIMRLAIVLVLVYKARYGYSQQCTPANYPAFTDLSSLTFMNPGQMLIDRYRFGCDGFVTRIEAYCVGRGAQTVEFHVWRRLTGTLVYNLVGKIVLPNITPDENNLLSYTPSRNEQIRVQPGDIVGVRSLNAVVPNPFRLQARFDVDIGARSYELSENEETPPVLNLNIVSNSLIVGLLPVIRVEVIASQDREEHTTTLSIMSTVSSTSIVPTISNVTISGGGGVDGGESTIITLSTTSVGLSESTIIVIAISGSVLGLGILLVVIIVTIVIGRRRNYLGHHTTNAETQNTAINPNPAYRHSSTNNPVFDAQNIMNEKQLNPGQRNTGTIPHYACFDNSLAKPKN